MAFATIQHVFVQYRSSLHSATPVYPSCSLVLQRHSATYNHRCRNMSENPAEAGAMDRGNPRTRTRSPRERPRRFYLQVLPSSSPPHGPPPPTPATYAAPAAGNDFVVDDASSAERSSDSDLIIERELAAEARRLRNLLGDPRPTSSAPAAAEDHEATNSSATAAAPPAEGADGGTHNEVPALEPKNSEEDRESECPQEEDECVDTPFSTTARPGDTACESSEEGSSSDGFSPPSPDSGLGHEGGTKD